MLNADQKDFQKAYRNNKATYRSIEKKTENDMVRKMLIFYAVECGLKYMLMNKRGCLTHADVSEKMDDYEVRAMGTHDLRALLKALHNESSFKFPTNIVTIHGDIVQCGQFHEACRYNIGIVNPDDANLFENVLVSISEWIGENC